MTVITNQVFKETLNTCNYSYEEDTH